jgi:hypothetical protein
MILALAADLLILRPTILFLRNLAGRFVGHQGELHRQ